MRYYKQVSDDDILAIGIGTGYTEITEAEYNDIMAIIQSRPVADGKGYRLKTDLTWQEYDLPPITEQGDGKEMTGEEATNVISE